MFYTPICDPASRTSYGALAMTSALSNTYSRLPVAFTHGKGVWLWDTKGRRYLDAMAGIGVSCLGHAHPKLVAAISEQAARVIHVSNL